MVVWFARQHCRAAVSVQSDLWSSLVGVSHLSIRRRTPILA
jgi:hypothetical protein